METSQHQKRIHLLISGKVQGVYYRSSACEKARVLGLFGTVRNLPSGQVELVAEGEESALQRLIAWCQMGPPAAEVSAVDVRYETTTGDFRDFQVVRHSPQLNR
ncbi:MAG TPA: acylphosphatase [Pseudomonadota bacterium]|nr:acylphosphatase [Pseudomonadota bacterium]